MSGFSIEHFISKVGQVVSDGRSLGCSWEDSQFLEDGDTKNLSRCLIITPEVRSEKIQGYRLLSHWLMQTPYKKITAASHSIFVKDDTSSQQRFIENANLVANELLTNALRCQTEAAGSPEYSVHRVTEGIFISVRDYAGTLVLSSFFPSFKSGQKQAQFHNPAKGAGLGLYLVLRYSSVILVESAHGASTTVSVFIPSRSDGTKLFYYNQTKKVSI